MSAPHHLTWCELYCFVAEALQKIAISSHEKSIEEPVTLPTAETVKQCPWHLRLKQYCSTIAYRTGFSKYACSCLFLLLIRSMEEELLAQASSQDFCAVLSSCVISAVCLEQAALSRVAVPYAVLTGSAAEVFQEEGCSLLVVLKLKL